MKWCSQRTWGALLVILRKQARTKHRVCNRCLHRFDHHCAWVKNCIGAWNTRYFLSYLLTLTVSAVTRAVVSTVFLVQLAVMSDWYLETYVDDLGHLQAVDPVVLTQYLFLTFPRILILVGFVVVLSFPLGAACASVCTWPLPTRPITSSTKATEPGASTAATRPGPHQQSRGLTRTSTPTGTGASSARSFYLHITRGRRNRDGKSATAF